ncbi:MAG: mucoidy inhibitor MuiA family protein [Candidatus Methanoplasma sp.]|jgi:uncharacterized protein (TIGR02231 family)|nr:mucoidy inhibitor MuiA family protein [Candidatus Methanoplasma sp.]
MGSKKTGSSVEDVRVFLMGAEIKRRMVLDTAEGKNVAVFDGLPQDIRPESINASVEKGGTLISADFEVDSFKESSVSKDIKDLKERLDAVKKAIKAEKSKLELLGSEEKFLDKNAKIGGNAGFTINDLRDIEKYHKGRKEAISASKAEAGNKLEDLTEEKERITKEMGVFSAGKVRYAGKISVEFFSEKKGKAEVTVSYYVNNAWWRPFHEIRMSDINSPVVLSMKGSIVQNTGEDWNSVNVRLSTGNPALGNEQPVLRPWHIDLVLPQKPRMAAKQAFEPMPAVACKAVECFEDVSEVALELPRAQVSEAYTTTEFALPAPLDIPSSNKPSKVEISRHSLQSEFFYYCVSKLDTDAFLIAKMGGWESLNLLAGEASIFQGNEYVGKTRLDPAAMDDSMEVSLGRDKGIIVTRERGKDMTSKGLIGKNKKALREWIITVRNTRSKEITMKLLDQVPLSANSAVTVDILEMSGAECETDTGILTWSLNIPAGGSVKKVLRYEVSYPKNGIVYID